MPENDAVLRAADRTSAAAPGRASARRVGFASPKSSTLTTPSGVILMLAGFRSRWTMPFSCAASRASAICRAIASASAMGTRA